MILKRSLKPNVLVITKMLSLLSIYTCKNKKLCTCVDMRSFLPVSLFWSCPAPWIAIARCGLRWSPPTARTIIWRISAWTGADCRDQHPVALIDIPWSESHWCLVDRALLVVRSFVVLVVACSTSSGLCLCCRMRDANNSSRLISSRICSSRTFLRSIVFLISEINRKLGPFPFSLSWDASGATSFLLGPLWMSYLPEGPAPPAFTARLSLRRTL